MLIRVPGLLFLLARAASAQARCPDRMQVGELFTGTAWSLPLPIHVDAPGESKSFRARFATRPFVAAPYYSYRFASLDRDQSGLEAEMLHHKLYLQNPVPPIERLEISHGYNQPMINVAGPGAGWQGRVGIGLVVAHPEGRVAGRELQEVRTFLRGGYHIAGVSAQLAVGRRYPLSSGHTSLFATPEVKLTAGWARNTEDSVTLNVPNVALHALGGLGVRTCR
jgi:hypothetical protein